MIFPENVGFSYGAVNDPAVMKMEVHYDNPDELTSKTITLLIMDYYTNCYLY